MLDKMMHNVRHICSGSSGNRRFYQEPLTTQDDNEQEKLVGLTLLYNVIHYITLIMLCTCVNPFYVMCHSSHAHNVHSVAGNP